MLASCSEDNLRFAAVHHQIVFSRPRLDVICLQEPRARVGGRYNQVRVVGKLDNTISVRDGMEACSRDDVRRRAETGTLNDAGRNGCNG